LHGFVHVLQIAPIVEEVVGLLGTAGDKRPQGADSDGRRVHHVDSPEVQQLFRAQVATFSSAEPPRPDAKLQLGLR
jgi:hypothetical protein